jgi:hypothetical protein
MSHGHHVYEVMCDLCRVHCRVDLLERVDVFPLGLVCPPCAAELRADEDDPRDPAEEYEGPECECHGFCFRCLGSEGGMR